MTGPLCLLLALAACFSGSPAPDAQPTTPVPQAPASIDLAEAPGLPTSPASRSAGNAAWVATYNAAVDKFNAGDPEGCATTVRVLLDAQHPGARRPGRGLYWECAMQRGWYAKAGELLVRSIHDGTHPEIAAVSHASILIQADRAEEAVAWLDLFPAPDNGTWRKTRLRALLTLERWDDVLAQAMTEENALLKASTGASLAAEGQTEAARTLLEAACPELDQPHLQKQCSEQLEALDG